MVFRNLGFWVSRVQSFMFEVWASSCVEGIQG